MKSYKSQDEIPLEKPMIDFFSNTPLSINSVKYFHLSYEKFEAPIKNTLETIKDFLHNYEEMADFIDYLRGEIWEKFNMKELNLKNTHFHLILFGLSSLEINILNYGYRLCLGELYLDVKKIFSSNEKLPNDIWNIFKYSSFYTDIKENIENKLFEKKYCLKNNIQIYKESSSIFLKNEESLEKLLKDLVSEDYTSDNVVNITSSLMLILHKTLCDCLEQYPSNMLNILKLTKSLIISFELDKFFKWDINSKKSLNSRKGIIEDIENDQENNIQSFIKGFGGKQGEKTLKEAFISFSKGINMRK